MMVRPARPADAHRIARVHIDAWKSTYRGIVPDEVLDGRSYEARERSVFQVLANPESDSFYHVAEADSGEIAGFAWAGPERSGGTEFASELYPVYILKDHQRIGIGRRLVSFVARDPNRRGLRSMLVWVLSRNPSRPFYERLGGALRGTQQIEIGGPRSTR